MGVNVQYPRDPLVNVLMTKHGQKTSILTQLQKSADHKYTKTQFHTHSARFMQSLCLEWQRNCLNVCPVCCHPSENGYKIVIVCICQPFTFL